MSSGWDPALYTRFEGERTRPAADLLAQVPLERPGSVVDLGCGPGNSTDLLRRRYPEAALVGVDTSSAMLEAARLRVKDCRFERADIADWTAPEPVDLLFANASLQWVPGHDKLLPRLMSLLAAGGALAVQMPDNLDEPSHALMREAAAEPPWGPLDVAPRPPMLPPSAVYDLLTGAGAAVTLWRTTYLHPMASAAAIVEWVRATGLRPYLDAVPDFHRAAFLARYERLIEDAYRPHADGMRLLAFPRLFIVARKGR